MTAMRLVRQRCQARPGQGGADRGHRSGVGVGGDQTTPERSLAVNVRQNAPSSALTPAAIKACTLITRPASRT
ncbi:MAG: hypothetical protein QOF25_456 [Mycobacterium sp.]|nr:hypothetical protein [Mycobacterium sp.]